MPLTLTIAPNWFCSRYRFNGFDSEFGLSGNTDFAGKLDLPRLRETILSRAPNLQLYVLAAPNETCEFGHREVGLTGLQLLDEVLVRERLLRDAGSHARSMTTGVPSLMRLAGKSRKCFWIKGYGLLLGSPYGQVPTIRGTCCRRA